MYCTYIEYLLIPVFKLTDSYDWNNKKVVWFDTLITGCIFKMFSFISLIVNWLLETLMKLQCQYIVQKYFYSFYRITKCGPGPRNISVERKGTHNFVCLKNAVFGSMLFLKSNFVNQDICPPGTWELSEIKREKILTSSRAFSVVARSYVCRCSGWLFSRVLASHRGDPGSIPGRDMSGSGLGWKCPSSSLFITWIIALVSSWFMNSFANVKMQIHKWGPCDIKPPSSVFFISLPFQICHSEIENVCVCLSCRLQEEGVRGAGRFPLYLAALLMLPPGQFLFLFQTEAVFLNF